MAKVRSFMSVAVPAALVVGFYFVRGWFDRFDEIPYRGQTFKLAKKYWGWDDYKQSPELAADQVTAAQQAVQFSKITPTYTNRWDMIQGTGGLQFPGWGMGVFGESLQPDGSKLAGCAIEVPAADKDRVVVYRCVNDTWTLIDDFVWSSDPTIMNVEQKEGKLVYSSLGGTVIVTRDYPTRLDGQ